VTRPSLPTPQGASAATSAWPLVSGKTICSGCAQAWDAQDGLSARSWASVVEGPARTFVRKQCRHCLDPACVSACPVGALSRAASGAVIYDNSKCMGCRYCMMACPYGSPAMMDQTVPYVRKCVLCQDRILTGRQPACTEACRKVPLSSATATLFSPRPTAERLQGPGCTWTRSGRARVGGTSVLTYPTLTSLFSRKVAQQGTPRFRRQPPWPCKLSPFVFTGVVGAMAGVTWIIKRRMTKQSEGSDD